MAIVTNFLLKDEVSVGIGGSILTILSSNSNYRDQDTPFIKVGRITGSLSDSTDYFGASLACSKDGSTLIVGASRDEEVGSGVTNFGLVYVFDSTGGPLIQGSYSQVGILTGNNEDIQLFPYNSDSFGCSVACSEDGKTIFVGSRYEDDGVVYVFDRVENSFDRVGIISSPEENAFFGSSVACSADGTIFAIGSPVRRSVSVYERTENNFNRIGILTGAFTIVNGSFADNDNSLAMSKNGDRIFIGAYKDSPTKDINDTSGVTYIFDRVGNTYTQVGVLTSLYASDNGYFGFSVACNADGTILFVGAPRENINNNNYYDGIVHVYEDPFVNGNFYFTQTLVGSAATDIIDSFGSSLSCTDDGNTLVVGAPGDKKPYSLTARSGLVYKFRRSGDSYIEISSHDSDEGINGSATPTAHNDYFGSAVLLNSDGTILFTGATVTSSSAPGPSTGVVHIFDDSDDSHDYVIGIGSTNPKSILDIAGNLGVFGNFTSKQFVGYGTYITNNPGIATGILISNRGKIGSASTIKLSSTDYSVSFESGISTISLNVINYLDKITSIGNSTNNSISVGDIKSSGIISATFYGDGSKIRGIRGSHLVSYASSSEISNSTNRLRYLDTNSVGNIGIGSTTPTSKLTVHGDARFSGVVTAAAFDGNFIGEISATTSEYSFTAGIATYAITAGIATYATTVGIATVSQGLVGTPNIDVGNIIALGATFSNDVSILGTLNYSNFSSTNTESLGIITARSGLLVGSPTSIGATVSSNGDASFSGILTATGGFNIGIQSSGVSVTNGVITALNFINNGNNINFSYSAITKTITINTSVVQRTFAQGTTSSIGVGSTANLNILVGKSYILHKVGVSTSAWVRIYTDSNSRQSDLSRLETEEPSSGSGVIAEVITSGISTVLITPGSMGFNNDNPPTSNAYLAVTNKGTSTQPITITLYYLPRE